MKEHKSQPPAPASPLFFDVFTASPIGISVENLEGQPLFVNPALCKMLGFSEEEICAKHCVEFSPPDDAKKDWALFEELRAGQIDHYSLDKRFFRKDGSLIWGRLTICLLSHRQPPLVLGMVEDITDKKTAEERLRLSEANLQKVVSHLRRAQDVANAAPVMIWTSGPDRLCTYVNKAWLDFTGTSLETELGSGRTGDLHPDDRQGFEEDYYRAFDLRQPFTLDYRARRHDGEYRWVQDLGVPRFEADGSFAGYIRTITDMTERKRAEQTLSSLSGRLIEAQEQERRYIARELHDDVSQNLALLAVHLQSLQANPPGSEVNLREKIGAMLTNIAEIADDVHSLSHRLHTSRLETLGLVATMSNFCRELSKQRNVEVDFSHREVPEDLPEQTSLCLFRVLQEGLNNAVKYSGVRKFEVLLEKISGELQLTIRDQGAGFDPGMAMFPMGLGLISMRERVNLVKGMLAIESKPLGGTAIKASVPILTTPQRVL